MSDYFRSLTTHFSLFGAPGKPAWRTPQLAALGAILAHWSLGEPEPPLVALPTGVGKTAVAMALPYLVGAERVLVVVPSTELRRQTVASFKSQSTLLQIGAISPEGAYTEPIVQGVSSKVKDWDALLPVDVVVALPNSISPEYYKGAGQPPNDFFDLVIIDEAHHAPARTWNAILEYYKHAKSLLLTATPRRRDRQRVPGKLIYYYPLRRALEENLYQPVSPIVLPAPPSSDKEALDQLIADQVSVLLTDEEHRTSQFLIRAATIARATLLAEGYRQRGFAVAVIHSKLRGKSQRRILDDLRNGKLRGVAVVGMLIEGFDLPSLRIVAYHDKHRSLETTAQLIGRLARVDESYPQWSVVVTVNDLDVYPQLQGVVRDLYSEDHDWASILPGIIDAEIEYDRKNLEYARSYEPPMSGIDLGELNPLRRASIYENEAPYSWDPSFRDGDVPPPLSAGNVVCGQTILYAGLNLTNTTLLVITSYLDRPRWHGGNTLDAPRYELHLLSYRRSVRTDRPHLLLINTQGKVCEKAFLELLGATKTIRPADPTRLQEAFDSLARISVSSIGVRNTYGGRGIPSYRQYAGSGIEGGLRLSDTAQSALGHAMVQVGSESSAFTAGVSTGKGKYWETRYTPLRLYEDFVTELCERYWFPAIPSVGPLLPQISRGRSLSEWPSSRPLAAELDYALIGAEWEIVGVGPLDRVELYVGRDPTADNALLPIASFALPILAGYPRTAGVDIIWRGKIDVTGGVAPVSQELSVRRGHSSPVAFSDLLTERPPTIFFGDGTIVHGPTLHLPQPFGLSNLTDMLERHVWTGVDIGAETRAKAKERDRGRSIHEEVESYLRGRMQPGRNGWILGNDGAGEIADYIVVELTPASVHLELWHAKFAGNDKAGVRVTDLEEVVAQAIKSRRWFTDRRFWKELGDRLEQRSRPYVHVIYGKRKRLEIVLGQNSRRQRLALTRRTPVIQGQVGIVQPGLSRSGLLGLLESDFATDSALQIQQLLSVWQDSLNPIAPRAVVLCAP